MTTPDESTTSAEPAESSYGQDDGQDYVDRSKLDFDPADGLYTGTAVTGDSKIPTPDEDEVRKAAEKMGAEKRDG